MEPGVDRGNTRLRFAAVTPELCGINLPGPVCPSGIPGDHLFAKPPDVCHHFRDKGGVGELHFIGSDMDPGCIGKHFGTDFLHQSLQYFHSLRRLHVVSDGPHKGSAVTGHIDLRNQQHVVLATIFGNFVCLGYGIILCVMAFVMDRIVKLRKNVALQPPSLVFGQVPVENVDLEL